ncbi:hypothetical protein [Hoeflea sp.]|nr:hypothetical protein [Hoeflea sp.]
MALPERIPIFSLSGFLGSGKSTLPKKLLAVPLSSAAFSHKKQE